MLTTGPEELENPDKFKEMALRCTQSIKVSINQSQNSVSIHLGLINSAGLLLVHLTDDRHRGRGTEIIRETARAKSTINLCFFLPISVRSPMILVRAVVAVLKDWTPHVFAVF